MLFVCFRLENQNGPNRKPAKIRPFCYLLARMARDKSYPIAERRLSHHAASARPAKGHRLIAHQSLSVWGHHRCFVTTPRSIPIMRICDLPLLSRSALGGQSSRVGDSPARDADGIAATINGSAAPIRNGPRHRSWSLSSRS